MCKGRPFDSVVPTHICSFTVTLPCLLLAIPLTAWAQNPYAADSKAPEAGRGIFRIYCAPCHGLKADGGRGPDLTLGTYTAGNSDADLHRVISRGVAGSEMPDFNERLGGDNIWKVVSYIRSAAKQEAARPTGNAASGEKLFWGKGGCGQCHQVETRGGRVGPELTSVGRKRSLAYLRYSVTDPNKDITPGYFTIEVETRDGRRITGVQRGFDNFSAQLMDANESYYSFWKSGVKSMKREFRSLMPGYGKAFSPGELEDIVAYLYSLRGN
jgi:cytochrome c oxidase cbb3-type subunit 3